MNIFRLMTILFTLFTTSVYAADSIRDKTTGVVFPQTVAFDHVGKTYQLHATGEATRKKFFIAVYSIASYLQVDTAGGGDKFDQMLSQDTAKQLTQKWVHAAGADKIQEGYLESFKNTLSPEAYAKLHKEITDFVQLFNQDVNKGDEYILRWAPVGYVEVISNGKKLGSVDNADFAKALWSIWFGPKSVVDRNQLVALMK